MAISKGFKSVHPSGHPINHSIAMGLGAFPSIRNVSWRTCLLYLRFVTAPNPHPFLAMLAVGLGSDNPYPFAIGRTADGVTAQHSPARIKPHLGQVSENSSESSKSESWTVFHEDVAWSYLANDPSHFSPQAGSLAIEPSAVSSNGYVLTRESARNHVNKSLPRLSVKGANVIPNREGRENAVILSGGKNACGVGVLLDRAYRSPSEKVAAEYSATSARE
nr:hypothetical protein [Halomonas sp. BN3-1]